MEEKKEALRKAASESTIADSTLQENLEELSSVKPRPYGTIHAVSLLLISLSFSEYSLFFTMVRDAV